MFSAFARNLEIWASSAFAALPAVEAVMTVCCLAASAAHGTACELNVKKLFKKVAVVVAVDKGGTQAREPISRIIHNPKRSKTRL